MTTVLERALELRAQGAYRDARAALAGADDVPSLLERSRIEEEFGAYGTAESAALRAVELSGHSAAALARLAGAVRSQRRLQESVELAEEAVQAAGDDGDRAESLLELAVSQLELARHALVEAALRDAAPLVTRMPEGLRRDRARFTELMGIGSLARDRGRYSEAETGLRAAIAYAEERFGGASLELAYALNGLGMVFKYSGRFDEALAQYEPSIAILVAAVGEEHPDVASLYHNLGGLEHARQRYETAEPHARKSVEIRRRVAPGHPSIAEDEAAWASILSALGRDDEAEPLFRHAIDVLEGVFGPDHPEVAVNYNNLGRVLQRRGDNDAAEAAYRRALAAKERTIGPDHPSVATTLNNLAIVARRTGRADEAEGLYRRAIAIYDRTVEPDHPNRLLAIRNCAKLLRAAGRDEEAELLEAQGRSTAQPAS